MPLPAFLPPEIRQRLAGYRCTVERLPEVVRRRMRTPEKIGVAEHAEKYRVVTEEPHTGPWRHDLAPHTVQIMDTFAKSHVRSIWFCGVDQSGKTNTMLNCMHWAIDIDPGNIFYLMPTEATSDKIMSEKIIPMLRASKRLKRYVSRRDADTTLGRVNLANGVTIRPANANSASSMATFAAKHCFGDEVDKYPQRTGSETSPPKVLAKRNRLYKGRYKRFFASTPADLFIYSGMMSCVQVWEWYHRCPECGELFKPAGEGIVVDDALEPGEIGAETEVLYTCSECGSLLSDYARNAAIRGGGWICIKGANVQRPSRVGFHHRAFDCLDVPLYEIAAAWRAAETGGITEKKDWAHGYEAVDYVHEQTDRNEEFILRLVDQELPRGVVPAGVCALLLLVDTQRLGFFYQVWAVHYGRDQKISVIDHGFLESFTVLRQKAEQEYYDAAGTAYRIQAGFIDSGGGTNPQRPKHSRTVEVYDFCRKNKMFRALKGRRTMETPWSVKRLDFYPSSVGKKVPIPGGLKLYTLNTTLFKDELDRKLQIEPGDAGGIIFHAEVGKDLAAQLCTEYRDDRGYWECPKGKANHQWDVAVYGLALAEIMGLKNRRPAAAEPARRKRRRATGFVSNY